MVVRGLLSMGEERQGRDEEQRQEGDKAGLLKNTTAGAESVFSPLAIL